MSEENARGRDQPGAEIEERTGGEREFPPPPPRGTRWWPLAVVAAAVILLVLQIGAVGLLTKRRLDEALDLPLPSVDLPDPDGPEKLILDLSASGEITVKGKRVDEAELREYLAQRAKECRADPEHPLELSILIRAEKEIDWKDAQRIMQICASPEVKIHALQYATRLVEDPTRTTRTPSPSEEDD